jgi:hypothetical protein
MASEVFPFACLKASTSMALSDSSVFSRNLLRRLSGAFVVEPPESDLMRQQPRDPGTPFMNREMLVGTIKRVFPQKSFFLGHL